MLGIELSLKLKTNSLPLKGSELCQIGTSVEMVGIEPTSESLPNENWYECS